MTTRNDLDLYDRHASDWWDAGSRAFRSLHRVKAHNLREIDARWGTHLRGATVVDLGCGGGLLTIPLAERGARTIGIDLSSGSLRAAVREAERRGVECRFVAGDVLCPPLDAGCADFVVLADVLEHLSDPPAAIAAATRLLRRGGRMFVNTINRTSKARLLAVTLAEGLGFVPRGTHDAALFVRPDELQAMAEHAGLKVEEFVGEAPRLLATLRSGAIELRGTPDLSVLYSAFLCRSASP